MKRRVNIENWWRIALYFVFGNLALTGLANASPQRVALLIGNWDYDGNGKFDAKVRPGYVSDLKNPCSDVELVKSALVSGGFGNDIRIICNLDKATFERETDDFANRVKGLPSQSLVFIYYAGHGMQHYGYTYEIPVLFKLMPSLDSAKGDEQIGYMLRNAVDIQKTLRKFPRRDDVGIFVALDQCRDDPIKKDVAYNDAVKIVTPDNVLIQYAASAGDRTDDGEVKNSEYAKILSDEITRGGSIGSVVANVNSRTGLLYKSGERRTYATSDIGEKFASFRSPMLLLGHRKVVTASTSAHLEKRKLIFRNVYDNPSLDIFWCEGKGELARFEQAVFFAKAVASRAKELGVGRVMVKPLPELTNLNNGYNVSHNIMRYDPGLPKERTLLENIANEFPEMGLLPQRGVGVNGKPTQDYVSAFICSGYEP